MALSSFGPAQLVRIFVGQDQLSSEYPLEFMKTKLCIVLCLLLCTGFMGCARALFNTRAEMTASPEFKFEKGQRIAVLPVAVNGNPSLTADAASTAAFAVHLANMGYKVYEINQLRLEAKKNGASLPDTLNFDTYPLIAKATGVQLILQSVVDYAVTPAQTYGGDPVIYTRMGGHTVATGGSTVLRGEATVPRAQSMSIIDATSGAVLARGYVNAGYSSMPEQLTDALEDIIWKLSLQ
jgi:hypothetical protein